MRETAKWPLGPLGSTTHVVATVVGTALQTTGVAMIDTGCDLSRIQRSLFDALPPGILPTRAVDLLEEQRDGTYKPVPHDVYAIAISFPNTKLAPTVVEMMPWNIHKVTPGIDFLLGRNFLAQCEFTYDGTRGMFTLTTDRP